MILYTMDNCKRIYETIYPGWGGGRFKVRKVSNRKILLDIPSPVLTMGNARGGDSWDDEISISNSVVFKATSDSKDYTYVGHQLFSFALLEKGKVNVDYYVYLTPTGMVKPYVVGKKYIYSLRDKVAATIASLDIDPTKYWNEQIGEVDSKFENVKKIPFPVKMMDAGLGE